MRRSNSVMPISICLVRCEQLWQETVERPLGWVGPVKGVGAEEGWVVGAVVV